MILKSNELCIFDICSIWRFCFKYLKMDHKNVTPCYQPYQWLNSRSQENPAYYHLCSMLVKQMVNTHSKMHNMERSNK